MERWKDKVAVVTGASSGIGAAIAERLVGAGLKVAGFARRQDVIEKLASKLHGKPGSLHALKIDICKEEDILKAFEWIKSHLGPVHILINNAGVFRISNLIDGETKLWKETFDVNVLGLCIATREAIRDMKANNIDGHIIHINSIAGHRAFDMTNVVSLNVYAASKFAVTALTETLRQELKSFSSRIKITSISPGFVTSDFRNSAMEASSVDVPLLKAAQEKMVTLLPEDVAEAVLHVLATPPHVQVDELIVKPIGEAV